MSLGRIGVSALAVLVLSGGLIAAGAFDGDDRGVTAIDYIALGDARRDDPAALQEVAEEDDRGDPGTDDGDRTRDQDGTRGGNNGGANSADGDRTRGDDGTRGGNNTGDGDGTWGNDGTGGGDNTRAPAGSGGDTSAGGADT